MTKLSRRTANALLIIAFFIFACMSFLLLWTLLDEDEDVLDVSPRTPQTCANQYQTLTSAERSWWNSSEDYINSCVR